MTGNIEEEGEEVEEKGGGGGGGGEEEDKEEEEDEEELTGTDGLFLLTHCQQWKAYHLFNFKVVVKIKQVDPPVVSAVVDSRAYYSVPHGAFTHVDEPASTKCNHCSINRS